MIAIKDHKNVSAIQNHDMFYEVPDSGINVPAAYVYSFTVDQTTMAALQALNNQKWRNKQSTSHLTTSSGPYLKQLTHCTTA
jgi:hypothetical protein